MYNWLGMKKLTFEEVRELHESEELAGMVFLLYDDGTEAVIEEGYDWQDIIAHYERGGEFGIEL